MIYKVKVLCEANGKTFDEKPCVIRHWVTCLVTARNDDEAFAAATKFAETQTPFGPKWESFNPREACQVHLPAAI